MILRSKNKVRHLSQQLRHLNKICTGVLAGKYDERENMDYHGEFRILQQLFVELYERTRKQEIEADERYQRLQLSYIELEERYAQSYTFRFVQEQIGRELNSHELLIKTLDVVVGVFGSRRSIIYMTDESKNALVEKASCGYKDNSEYRSVISFSEDNFYVQTCKEKKVFAATISGGNEQQYQMLMVPLNARHSCLGLMVLEIDMGRTIDNVLRDFAESIAREVSLSLENAYLYDKMRNMVIRDALTGVYNRMYLMDYMADLFIKNPKNVAVMIFDLDHFKQVNDRFGHLNGDMVLKTTARIVDEIVKPGMVARYGGEEFVIVLPNCEREAAYHVGECVRKAIEQNAFLDEARRRIPVTLSIGLATYPMEAEQYEELLKLADQALYKAKNSGRNRLCIA